MVQPLDIKTQKFKKGLFGYKSIDVDGFVDSVYRAYDELFKEHAELKENNEKLNAALQENRLKMFDMENKIRDLESNADDFTAKKKADDIIKNAESEAAQIVGKAAEQGKKFEEPKQAPKKEVKPEKEADKPKESATAKFFKKEETASVINDDDDEIFVGEIEEKVQRDRMMIGDGVEEEDMDFEFL